MSELLAPAPEGLFAPLAPSLPAPSAAPALPVPAFPGGPDTHLAHLRAHIKTTGVPLYFAPPTTEVVREQIRAGTLGAILTPAQGNLIEPGWWHIIDNGCFQQGDGYPGDTAYLRMLEKLRPFQQWCVLVNLPDVVGNHWATLERSYPMLPRVQELGYPASFVLQDGEEMGYPSWHPWDEGWDAFFIGGTDRYKLADHTASLARLASSLGLWVHMGRVNSGGRLTYAARQCWAHSADGTRILRQPTEMTAEALRWRARLAADPNRFTPAPDGPEIDQPDLF
ncbi:hypothetical protein GCM10022221_67930 [Actinocorallia aurea]